MEKTQSQREDVIPVLLAAEAGGTKIKPVEKEARLALAEGEIVLKAIDDGGTETNSRELASVLYLAQQVAVFPGDLGIAGIRKLIDGQKQITIWTVPHHGSRFSADEEIYMRLKEKGARLAVVSAGQNNRYGHPHQEVLEYLNASHIAVHRTDLEGAVCLNLNEGKKSRIETSKSIYGDNL
jgi:competence protein ComEC